MKVNPNDPAYPCTWTERNRYNREPPDRMQRHIVPGIPIRLEIASRLMASVTARYPAWMPYDTARATFIEADALIAAYNESQPDEAKEDG